jgi:hypothetical protein
MQLVHILYSDLLELTKTCFFKRALSSILSNILIIDGNLKLNVPKCEFANDEIIYLGHRITQNSIGVDPSKVEVIDRIEVPNSRQKLRRFLGMATYY